MATAAPTHHRSYFEEFLRARGGKPMRLESDKLVGDRAAYVSFLENQLERVSAACLSVHEMEGRMEEQTRAMEAMHKKMAALTELTELTQAYTERQGHEAGTAVAGLHAALQDLASRTDSHNDKIAALSLHTERVADVVNNLQARANAAEGAQQRLQADVASLSARLESTTAALREHEARAADRATVANVGDAVEAIDGKVERAVLRISEAMRAIEDARAAAMRAADTAVAAEAAAISASEAARHAASSSHAASSEAQRASAAASQADQRALAAGSTATAALRNLVASTSAPQASRVVVTAEHERAVSVEPSLYMPVSGDDEHVTRTPAVGTMAFSATNVSGPLPSVVGEGVARVLETVLPHLQQLSQRVASTEVDTARLRATIAEHQHAWQAAIQQSDHDAGARLGHAMDEQRAALAAVAQDVRRSIAQVADRIEEVGTAWTTWEAAFSQSHASARDASLAASRARDAAWQQQREEDRHGLQQLAASLRDEVQRIRDQVLGVEAALAEPLDAAPANDDAGTSPSAQAGGSLSVSQLRQQSPANGVTAGRPMQQLRGIVQTLRTELAEALQDVRTELETLGTQLGEVDTEHKQLVRASDGLVRRWTDAHSAITELQVQVSELQQQQEQEAAQPRAELPAVPVAGDGDAASATGQPAALPLSQREIIRIVDTLVQPRMQDIANELHRRMSEELTLLSAKVTSPSLRSKASRSHADERAGSRSSSVPVATRLGFSASMEARQDSLGPTEEAQPSASPAAAPQRAEMALEAVQQRLLQMLQADRDARELAMSQLRASVAAAEAACRTVAEDAVRSCSRLVAENQQMLSRTADRAPVPPQEERYSNAALTLAQTAHAPEPIPAAAPAVPSPSAASASVAVSNMLAAAAALLSAQQSGPAPSNAAAQQSAGVRAPGTAAPRPLVHTIGFPQQLPGSRAVQAAESHDGGHSARGSTARAPIRPLPSFTSPGEVVLPDSGQGSQPASDTSSVAVGDPFVDQRQPHVQQQPVIAHSQPPQPSRAPPSQPGRRAEVLWVPLESEDDTAGPAAARPRSPPVLPRTIANHGRSVASDIQAADADIPQPRRAVGVRQDLRHEAVHQQAEDARAPRAVSRSSSDAQVVRTAVAYETGARVEDADEGDRVMIARAVHPLRPTRPRAAMLHESSPGRRVGFVEGRAVVSVQTQAGPAMSGVSNADLHCAHEHRRPQVPSRVAATLPPWYATRAAEIGYTSRGSSRRSSQSSLSTRDRTGSVRRGGSAHSVQSSPVEDAF